MLKSCYFTLSLSLTLASFALFGQIQIVSSQFLACSYSLDHKLFSFVSFSHSDVFILVHKFLAFCLKFPFSGRNRGRFCLYHFLLLLLFFLESIKALGSPIFVTKPNLSYPFRFRATFIHLLSMGYPFISQQSQSVWNAALLHFYVKLQSAEYKFNSYFFNFLL